MDMNEKRGEKNIVNNDNYLPPHLWVGLLLLTFIFLFFLPLTSAVDVAMESQFAQGATFVAVFSGNFYDQITEDSVNFYRHSATTVKIPLTLEVVRINDDFYVYTSLGTQQPGNYSINIEGVRYYKATQIVDDDIISNFTITEEAAAFSVAPGVVNTGSDFSVVLQNLQDSKTTVTI